MKTRFNTYDLICSITELQQYIGLRVNQVYDIDKKTYLIRLQKTDEKVVILLESGNRIHTTDYEWPKNVAPSGFSMKLRKHLRNKRLESLKQLGFDRIVDLQFGTGEAAYHVFLELYDKGNIVLTDCDLVILNILRPHTEGDRIRFAVKEKYPVDRARENTGPPSEDALKEIFSKAKAGDNLKKILNPHLEYGPAIIDHILLEVGLQGTGKLGKNFEVEKDLSKLITAFNEAEEMIKIAQQTSSKGYIIQKAEKRPNADGTMEDFLVNQEFHPFLFRQHSQSPFVEYESFDKAVDNFFSSLETQKIDMKAISQEKEAMKKLDNVKKDHDQRLMQLAKTQELDREKAELITKNQVLVDNAIKAVRGAIANQMSWPDIKAYVKDAAERGDPIASCIKYMKLEMNHITLELSDPYAESSEDSEGEGDNGKKPMLIDIDLDLSAFGNATKYYDQKRSAAKKQQKTLDAQGKAFKSAEKKTKQTLKEMKAIVNISKVRKVFWFEKFFWFISSENYLVIGGRDMIQNELIVKRYMRPGDIYVHADIHGASSVVIKNPTGEPVPPKTLNEAGVMAICYSVAWDAKVVTTAWWVHSEQVSKTAPTGEYLTAGSFMVRGKKNFLPPGNLVMGFSFLFKLEESSVFRHKDERRVKSLEDEMSVSSFSEEVDEEVDEEVVLSEDDGDDDEDDVGNEEENKDSLNVIEEEKDEESEEDDNGISYPDTEIKIHHTGKEVAIETKSSFSASISEDNNDELVVYLGDDKPVIIKPDPPRKKQLQQKKQKQEENKKPEENSAPKEEKKDDGRIKRGQRGKAKKNKEKYKFEDEEDRKLRLEILQNVVTKKSKKEKKKEKEKNKEAAAAKKAEKPKQPAPKPAAESAANESGDESEEEAAPEPVVNTDLEALNSLTGNPLLEDELLFAVPVVAPYNAVQNYKFKVKITPGTGKRGKAAKTAVEMFLRDKACTPREKDLLKSVKDEAFARNLPGKVKVSAPHLHKK